MLNFTLSVAAVHRLNQEQFSQTGLVGFYFIDIFEMSVAIMIRVLFLNIYSSVIKRREREENMIWRLNFQKVDGT